ncbi:MAG: hypothetical protein U0441_10085 [Polyangiaceae bacterium]
MKSLRSSVKTLVSLSALLGTCAAPALAYAAADNYVEVQFDAETISDIVRRQIATQSTFCPQSVVVDSNVMYVDHLEFPEHGFLSRSDSTRAVHVNDFTTVEGYSVLYTQPMDVHYKSPECANHPGCDETPSSQAELTFELTIGESHDLCMRTVDARGLPEGMDAPKVHVCLPFNTDGAMRLAGLRDAAVSGAAVSLDADAERVALRLEMGRKEGDYDDDRVRDWQGFVDGEIQRAGARGNWSVFTHKSLILGAIQQRISGSLTETAGFAVDGAVETTWEPVDGGAEIQARFDGSFGADACPKKVHVSDIFVNSRVGINDIDAPTGLKIQGAVSYDVSNTDAAACGLSLGGPVGGLVFGALADTVKIDFSGMGPGCQNDGDFKFVCDEHTHPQLASVGPLQIARSTLEKVEGSSDGLTMSGLVRISGEDRPAVDARTSAFAFDQPSKTLKSELRLTGTAKMCGVELWAEDGGDLGLFTIGQPDTAGLPATYKVALPVEKVGLYKEKPFRVMATVKTSAGVSTYPFDLAVP